MARFAGDNTGVVFEPMSLASGGSAGNYSAAASAVDLGNSFSAMRDKAPRYDLLSGEAMKNAAAEKIAGIEGIAKATAAGLESYGMAKSYALNAQGQIEAAKKAAEAKNSAAKTAGIGGIISSGLSLLAAPVTGGGSLLGNLFG